MMIGSEPSIQAALTRLAKPAGSKGWVARRARELSQDHETWIVNERPPEIGQQEGALQSIRRFALGFRLAGDVGIYGEAGADSEAGAVAIAGWIDKMKAGVREKTGVGVLDALTVERDGLTVRFHAKGDPLVSGDAGNTAMNSDLGVELYSMITAGFPGMAVKTL